MRDAAEEKAERMFIREPRSAGLTEKALRERPRSEPVKWKSREPCGRKLRCPSDGSPADSTLGRPLSQTFKDIQYSSPDPFLSSKVDAFDFKGLRRADGSPVEDLNDLLRAPQELDAWKEVCIP